MSTQTRNRRFFLKWLSFGGSAALFLAACGESSSVSTVTPESTDAITAETEPDLGTELTGPDFSEFPQSVFSGDPTDTSVMVSTRVVVSNALPSVPVTLEVSRQQNFATIERTEQLTANLNPGFNYRENPGDYIVKHQLTGLEPAQEYFYRFKSPFTTSPVGSFRTMPSPNQSLPIRFLHMSCANEPPYPVAFALGQELDRFDPQFAVFNGDTVYADAFWLGGLPTPTIEYYRNLYRLQRDRTYTGAGFPDLYSKIPFIPNWDDHEVNNDFAGRAGLPAIQPAVGRPLNQGTLERLGYQAFHEYNPLRPNDDDPVQGVNPITRVFRTTRAGADAELFTLDLRQYRNRPGGFIAANAPIVPVIPEGFTVAELSEKIEEVLGGLVSVSSVLQLGLFGTTAANPNSSNYGRILRQVPRTMMGTPQKEWFKQKLRASTATFKIIISELIFTENFALPYDRWEGYWLERQEILNFILSNNIRNVVILSGDQHAGQISLVNPTPDGGVPSNPIYEIGTGPTGQSTLARSVREIAADIGLPRGDEVYYFLLNYFSAAEEFGGKPGATTRNLLFYAIDNPNYTTVEVNGGVLTAKIKDFSGNVLTDPLGRRGEISIFAN